jgi:integrase
MSELGLSYVYTFRHTYTTLLHANGEDVKVVQELLRHGSAKITIDAYAQAVTKAKRTAQTGFRRFLRRWNVRRKAYPCRRKRFLAVLYTNCPQI